MRVLTLSLGVALAIGLMVGCSKNSSQESATPKSTNLGTVELAAGQPSRHDLGGGATCVFVATPMDATSIELISVLEKSGKKVSSTRASAVPTDRPLEVSFGDIKVQLTPHLK